MNPSLIRTPDQRLRVFVSSTLGELAPERLAIRAAIERLRLSPVMFEDGARPHPPRSLYRAYLEQSHVFLGVYWQRYGWIAKGDRISGLEDEYRLAGNHPRLIYIKEPAPEREPRLAALLTEFKSDDRSSYKRFGSTGELVDLVERDLALLLTERFEAAAADFRSYVLASIAPVPLTRTLGREHETERVRRLLSQGTRLVTLTGLGGVGKTRLALAVAAVLGDAYPGGVFFVPLQTVTTADLVGRVIVDHLGIRTEGIWTPETALAKQFSDRRALLILDNLEQIEGVELTVREILERAPPLQILATSRKALRIVGEQEFPVSTLPVPGIGLQSAEQPAVALFLDRALAVNPAFSPDEAELRATEEICRRVDGLPLAIELAAARARLMPPSEVLKRLNMGFEILSSHGRDRPERQQTLRATLEWSRSLLATEEQTLLNRLSIFEDSFSIEAAETVAGFDGVSNVITSLTGLLDSSLVIPSDDPDRTEPRFRMLQTVQSYARAWQQESGEEDLLAYRHLEWFAGLCARARLFLCGPNQRSWAARFDQERANLRAAVASALRCREFGKVIDIAWHVAVFYEIRDAGEEPRSWIKQVVDEKPSLDPLADAMLRSIDVRLRADVGDFAGAEEVLPVALEVFLARDMPLEAAVTLMVESEVALRQRHDLAGAMSSLGRSTRLFASVNHDWGVARTEIMMGLLHWMAADVESAVQCLHRSLEHSRRIDNEPQIARALCLLSMLPLGNTEASSSRLLIADAARIIVRGQYRAEAAVCLEALALNSHASGRLSEASDAVALSAILRSELGLGPPPPVADAIASIGSAEAAFDGITGRQPQSNTAFSFLAERLLTAPPTSALSA